MESEESLPRVVAATPALAATLGLPLAQPEPRGDEVGAPQLRVERAAGRLQVRDPRRGAPGPVWSDFLEPRYRRRLRQGRRSLLARAAGLKPNRPPPIVVDATAGLGRDAYALAWLGCRVTAVERSPVVAALFLDALERAAVDGDDQERVVRDRIELRVADARDVLGGWGAHEPPDVVLLDPMFPERSKSALVRKELRVLRVLVAGYDSDDPRELFDLALARARQRVVVKRARNAPDLVTSPAPNHRFRGRSVRYDLYLA